jgi:hypothetical protein
LKWKPGTSRVATAEAVEAAEAGVPEVGAEAVEDESESSRPSEGWSWISTRT